MPFVLDASVTANWFMPDEAQHPYAQKAWMEVAADDAMVPLHWWFEVRMLVGERKQRFTERYTAYVLERLASMSIMEAPRGDDMATLALARRHRLSFYDAAYLELAQREGLPLATLDSEMAKAARAEGVSVVGAS
jgi:predicted nucleic acid-binding protein